MPVQQQERIKYLLEQYISGLVTESELHELSDLLQQNHYDQDLLHILEGLAEKSAESKSFSKDRMEKMISEILYKEPPATAILIPLKRRVFRKLAMAACLLAAVGTGVLYLSRKKEVRERSQYEAPLGAKENILPGTDKAFLILENGRTIELDSSGTADLGNDAGKPSFQLLNGELKYNANEPMTQAGSVVYNTLQVPRGGQYRLTLSDGTRIWLNSATSIKYPVRFTGSERRVWLRGEAYFEVAKNPGSSFVAQTNDLEIHVLGTHFNIKAYDDEPHFKTTLLEGSIKLVNSTTGKVLKPGQQALTMHQEISIVENADVDEAIAWKNGLFQFHNADIREVMKQVARWYDLDVQYEGTISSQPFGGAMERNLELSQLLKILQTTGMHFSLNGKTLTVKQ